MKKMVARSSGLTLLLMLTLELGACRMSQPVIDPGPKPTQSMGTISGTVSGPGGTSPVAARTVTAIDIKTGERRTLETSNTGGYTFKVPPGRYRVEVQLLAGEALEKQPGEVDIDRSDVDYDIDFIIVSKKPGEVAVRPQQGASRQAKSRSGNRDSRPCACVRGGVISVAPGPNITE